MFRRASPSSYIYQSILCLVDSGKERKRKRKESRTHGGRGRHVPNPTSRPMMVLKIRMQPVK